MAIIIRPLMPELSEDYFDFFENRAFTDDSPYRCYCQVFQMSKAEYEASYSSARTDPGNRRPADRFRPSAGLPGL